MTGSERRILLGCAAALAVLCLCEASYRGVLLLRARLSPDRRAFTLYAVGGSTTEGQPFTGRVSFPLLAGAMLSDGDQSPTIVVRNLAVGGETIFFQWRRLRRAVAYRRGPGAVLIYAGVEPGGPRPEEHSDGQTRLGRWLERRVIVRSFVLTDLLAWSRLSWLRRDAYSMSLYDFYLRQAAQAARDNGLTPVLSTVVSNMADMEPNFMMDEQTDPDEPRVAAGRRLEKAGRWRQAIAHYQAAAAAPEPLRPYLLYRIAKCWQALCRYDAAREFYWQAAEADTKSRFWRPSRAQNDVVRRAAVESGALLADSAALFERSAPHGLLGRGLFSDFHHPNLRGYALMARAFAEALGPALGTRPRGSDWDENELRRRFRLDDEYMVNVWLRTASRLLECACALYPWPEDRLAMARRCFSAVLLVQPMNRQALLGMDMVDSPAWRPLLRKRESIIPALLSLRGGAARGG